ncbi:MAG TPA: chromosome segregation protein SMC [Bacillota bacterium]|nr:chromosome segregation protein SMC [Bacillota bacterium]
MYLKRLELVGFKSFANRTELEFVPGVTAVVGPNGSGKSNISDAIRWVLGEQSAKSLRGSKMEDIIFAGSDTRKAVNYCEVALTLDNSQRLLKVDYSEVTISRRVYRSGESEYYINRQSCRLRDIIELFMDTGVGKEAYSIIGQGRIEEILSTKSEDRRGIFEEAASIVKYKARKREAEKKLGDTEGNLVRISDILTEIKDQIEPLQQQARKAQRYLELKEELKHKEIGLYLHHIEQFNSDWQQARQQLGIYNEQQTILASELSGLEAQLTSLRWKLNDQDKDLEQWQVTLLDVSEDVEKTEGKREVLRERKKNASESYHLTLEKRDQLEKRIDELSIQIQLEKDRLTKLTDESTVANKELKENKLLLDEVSKELATDVEQLKNDYIEILNHIASLKNDRRHMDQSVDNSGQKSARLLVQKQEMDHKKNEIQEKKNEALTELREITGALEQCVGAYKEIVNRNKDIQEAKEQTIQQVRKLEQRVESITSKKEFLTDMQASYTGFMQGVKEILKSREKGLVGIHGAVAELVIVSSELETAIEVALGGAMQHVVVENEAVGRKAIQWLKEHKGGRATLLPLDVIRPRKVSAQDVAALSGLEGFVGIASDLVTTEPRYQGILGNLLGTVVITKTLEQANMAARKTGYRYRFVTLEGDVVNPGGSMTGGTVQQKSVNLLGRSRQLEEMEKELTTVLVEKEQYKAKLSGLEEELSSFLTQQEDLRQRGEELRLNEQKLKGRLNECDTEDRILSDRMASLEQEIQSLTQEKEESHNKRLTLIEQLGKAEGEEKQLKEKITNIESHRAKLQASKEDYSKRMTDLMVKAAEIRKQQEAVQATILRVEQERSSQQVDLESTTDYLNSLHDVRQGSAETEQELDHKILELRQLKEETGNKIGQVKEQRTATTEQIDKLDGDSRILRKRVKELEERLHKEELKAERCETQLDHLLLKLTEEYGYYYETAKEIYPLPAEPKKTEEQVNQLKAEIHALGMVNMGSIEEYERQSERLQFLSGQMSDLQEAKETLYQVIREIDQEMSRRFLETFEAIREQFQQVFTQLFVGGHADLVLSNPQELLSTGVEIVAQPPGKKLQNLALLSGGEKALTAIALLFAILKVKPVPFCVLDEVEAALDDANVYRFADYLREFSGQTQFICVTHRKGTMEGADVLYGVTMEEQGVSKLVSVKLEDKSLVS